MFSNASQRIPKPFLEKIAIDKRISTFMDRGVIPLSEHSELKKLVDERDGLRYTCQMMLRRDGPPSGVA